MTDPLTRAERSKLMGKIRGSGNASTEGRLAAVFRTLGITGWRRRQAVFGKPDFVFRRLRLAVFVDGCFWHGCPRHATQPRTNARFWREKLAANQARDRLVNRTLRAGGWRVLRIWEHELCPGNTTRLTARLRRAGLPDPENTPANQPKD